MNDDDRRQDEAPPKSSDQSAKPIHPVRAVAWGVAAFACGYGFLVAPTAVSKVALAVAAVLAWWRVIANLDFF